MTWRGKGRSAAHGRVERGERRRNRAALFQRMIDGLEGARSVDSETRNCVAREMGSARTRATHHDPVFFFPISSETALPRCPVAGEGCGERRARCVVRDASRRVRSNPKRCFWVTIARRAEYSSLEERLRACGARDAGFDDGRLGRTSVPWVAREYLADAGTNATRANRAELSSIGTRSHLCPNQKKNLFSETRIQSERLGFCRTWRARTSVNFLSRRPCPRPLVFPCLQETDGRGNVRVP